MKIVAGIGIAALALGGLTAAAQAAGAPRARYDFDGDRKDDLAVYHRPNATWFIKQSGNGSTRQQQFGDVNSTPVPGDYDGDAKTDIAIFNKRAGDWYILQSKTGSTRVQHWGDPDSFPVQGDYDGDGKTDIAVYYRTSGEWVILQSVNNTSRSWLFGGTGFRPVPADYDGDGKTDIAVYYPAFRLWSIINSSNGQNRQLTIGGPESRPAVGYFDGDNKADPAVYTAATGQWQILDSTTGRLRTIAFGAQVANSVPGDYDGDNKTDIAVYVPQSGRWYISQSGNGQLRNVFYGTQYARALPSYAGGAIEGLRVHCHGDSITYGTSSGTGGPATGYPILLEKSLEGGYGGDIVSLNYGIPGERTRDGVERLPLELFASKASVLLIMEGTNDHFFETPFDTIESNLRQMVSTGLSMGKYVVIATIPPCVPATRGAQHQRIQQFNPRIYNIARDYRIPVAQVFESITSVPNWENTLMDQPTGNHPNDAGYQYVRAAFEAALAPALDGGNLY